MMEHSETAGDADNSASAKSNSESVTMEEQSSSPRASEDTLPGNSEADAVVDGDKEEMGEPSSVVSDGEKVNEEELPESGLDNTLAVESGEKNAGETKDGSECVEDDISAKNANEPSEEEDKLEAPEGSQSTVIQQTKHVVDSSEVEDVEMPSEVEDVEVPSEVEDVVMPSEVADVEMPSEEPPSVITDDISRGSDGNVERESDEPNVKPTETSSTLEADLEDDAPLSKRVRLDISDSKIDTVSGSPEDSVKDSEPSKPAEKNGGDLNANDVEVIADNTPDVTCTVEAVEEEYKPEIIEDTSAPRKRARAGRPRKNSRPSESFLENGSPEAEPHLDENLHGRPRRKAAQKAGDQIKQIVGNEEEINEILEKTKETEWTAEPKTETPPRKICYQCCRLRPCQYHLLVNGVSRYMCTTPCFQAFRKQHPSSKSNQGQNETGTAAAEVAATPTIDLAVENDITPTVEVKAIQGKERTLECAFCNRVVPPPTSSEKSLSWETMEFCNEGCLDSDSHCPLVLRISKRRAKTSQSNGGVNCSSSPPATEKSPQPCSISDDSMESIIIEEVCSLRPNEFSNNFPVNGLSSPPATEKSPQPCSDVSDRMEPLILESSPSRCPGEGDASLFDWKQPERINFWEPSGNSSALVKDRSELVRLQIKILECRWKFQKQEQEWKLSILRETLEGKKLKNELKRVKLENKRK